MQRRMFMASVAGLMMAPPVWAPLWAGEFAVEFSEAEWRARLSDTAYAVLREAETERAGSSPLAYEAQVGVYACGGCALPLYVSAAKFESGTGWPSFSAALPGAVGTKVDDGWFGDRIEVHCSRCGGHLGHVFGDGPAPTGKRYCMNGAAMVFLPA